MNDSKTTKREAEGSAMDRANTLTQVINQHVMAGFRGLILINAGGAAALGAFIQAIWVTPTAEGALAPILHGIIWLLFGTAISAAGFVARYLQFFSKNSTTPRKNLWWWLELVIIGLAICCFLAGMLIAVLGALSAIHSTV